MTKKPIDLTKGVAWLKEESAAILILVVYFCGVTAGAALTVVSGPVRNAVGHALAHLSGSTAPLTLFLISALISIAFCSILYGAGLCLVGYPCIYAVPLVMGTSGGAVFLSWMNTGEALFFVKGLLALPCYGASVCCLLMLCGYAAEMNSILLAGQGSREAVLEKKYAARFLILGGILLILDGLQALSIILLRHLQ